MMNSIRRTNLFALLLVGIFFGLSFLSALFPVLQKINGTLLLDSTLLLAILFYCAAARKNPVSFLRFRRISLQTLCVITVMAIVSQPLVSFLNFLSMLFASNQVAETITESVSGNYIWAMLTIAVIPAVVEECTYRGVILGGYREEDTSFRGIALSALLFAALHMNFNQMTYAFVLGLILGVLVELTGSVWSAVWFHFCINGISVQAAWSMNQGDMASAEAGMEELLEAPLETGLVLAPLALISLILILLLIYFVARINRTTGMIGIWFFGKEEPFQVTSDGAVVRARPRYLDIFAALALLLCLAAAVISEISLT